MSGLPSPGRLQGRLVLLRDPREADAAGLARAFVDDPGLGAAIGVETDPGEAEWRALSAAMIHSAERAGYALEGVLRSYTFERGRPVDNAMLAVVA